MRAVSQEEKAALMTATEVVMSMTPERLIEPLRAASQAALREWILALRPEDPYLPAVPEDLTSLEAALRSWLSHFRAYIGHTTGLLSRHFGGDVKAGFEQLTNATYDRNAAYLLAWVLRNYSQHRGEIVNHRSVESSPSVRGKPFTFTPVLGIIPSKAAEASSGKTRAEMRAAEYPVRIERLVAEVMNECERLLIETYVLIREPFEAHVERI